MQWQYTPYVWLYIASAVVTLAWMASLWPRRLVPGGMAVLGLGAAIIEYALGYALEVSSRTLQSLVLSAQVQYLGIVSIPVFWFLFALQWAGHGRRLGRLKQSLLWILPGLTVILAWSYGRHGLLWQNVRLDQSGPVPAMAKQYGLGFWLFAVYGYGLVISGIAFLASAAMRSVHIYRVQATMLTLSGVVPLFFNVLYIFEPAATLRIDLTAPGFAISGLLVSWAIRRYQLFEMIPAARHAIFDMISDGVFVIDRQLRVVDVNPAGARLLRRLPSAIVGKPVSSLAPPGTDFVERFRKEAEVTTELTWERRGSCWHYEMRLIPLGDARGSQSGWLAMVRNITQRRRMEEKLAYLSTHDALTGLYNRSYFESEMQHLAQSRRPVTVVMADLDELKETNDALGHAAGDDLIRRAADVLRGSFGVGDMVARVGGDEFVVIVAGPEALTAEAATALVKANLLSHNLAYGEKPLRMAVGAALATDSTSLEDALRLADRSMYQDKVRAANGPLSVNATRG